MIECTASALVIRSLPVGDPSTDTGKRMIAGQRAEVYGASTDAKWVYVDAPAARGWVSKQYVTEAKGQTISPAWPKVPRGLDEIKKLFGDPGSTMCQAGRAHLPAPLKLSWADEKITVFACHKLLEDVFTSVFEQISKRGFWGLLIDYGGCYNYRPIKGAAHLSTHAWGISVDLNTLQSPLGQAPHMPQQIISVFEDHGFEWGGKWARPDGMHFQRATGY